MRASIDAIAVRMTKEEGLELRNQILKLTGGTMEMRKDELKGTPVVKLFDLLSGSFEGSTHGVHFVD